MDRLTMEQLRGLSDHDLLVRSAEKLENLAADVRSIDDRLKLQNGRVRDLEIMKEKAKLLASLAILVVAPLIGLLWARVM
jgi:hypothetical protein